MNIIISTCLVIVTVIIILVAIEIIETLKKVKSAAGSLEKLSRDIDDRVMEVEPAFKMVQGVSNKINNIVSAIINGITSLF